MSEMKFEMRYVAWGASQRACRRASQIPNDVLTSKKQAHPILQSRASHFRERSKIKELRPLFLPSFSSFFFPGRTTLVRLLAQHGRAHLTTAAKTNAPA